MCQDVILVDYPLRSDNFMTVQCWLKILVAWCQKCIRNLLPYYQYCLYYQTSSHTPTLLTDWRNSENYQKASVFNTVV